MELTNFSTFNRRALRVALASAIMLAGAGLGVNSYAASTTATASAIVMNPMTISKTTDLSFGSFARGAGGSVTVSNSGFRSATGAILSASGAASSAASFHVTGDGTATFSVGIAAGALTSVLGSDNMPFAPTSDFTGANVTIGDVTAAGGTLIAGALDIYVGGTLTVGAAQAAATDYVATITVTVDYN